MRALLQRVSQASVTVEGSIIGEIQQGLLVLLGVQRHDTQDTADRLLHKVLNYRLFADDQQRMNLSVKDIQGGILIVSQFTLAADTQKGLRPGFSIAAHPDQAQQLYDYFLAHTRLLTEETGNLVACGEFGADMQIALVNDGPVTFLLES